MRQPHAEPDGLRAAAHGSCSAFSRTDSAFPCELGARRATESIVIRDSPTEPTSCRRHHSLTASCTHTASDVFVILKTGGPTRVSLSRKSGHASLRAASVGDESGVPPVAGGAPGYRWPGSRGGGVRAGSGGRCAVPAACCGCEASGFALWLWRGVRECMVVVRRLSLLPTPGPFVAVKEIRCGGPPGGHPPLLPCARVSVSCTDEGPGRRRAVPVIYPGAAAGGGCV